MNDRELLELAAKAAGYKIKFSASGDPYIQAGINTRAWYPLIDDGDALRLAASLMMDVLQDAESISVKRYVGPDVDHQYLAFETIDGDRLQTTRRAIVRAAAEIGRAML